MLIDKSYISSYVKNKFTTSDYIKNRIKPTGNKKYYDEEVQFWVEQVYNSNWTETLFNSEFDAVYKKDFNKSLTTQTPNDYIGQTFFIDSKAYPKGLFVGDICIFTAKEDSTAPITLEVRRLINGVPESDIIPMSSVTLSASSDRLAGEIIPWQPVVTGVRNSLRQFQFEHPLFLEPGYYCFTLTTSSSNYSVYIAENGKGTLNTGQVVVNPYLGDFIYSGQGESWVIDPTKDLCFTLSKIDFAVGTRNLYLEIDPSQYTDEFLYDLLYFKCSTLQVPERCYIEQSKATVTEFGTLNENDVEVSPNSNSVLPSHSIVNIDTTAPLSLTLTLVNKDPDLTPIVDLHDTSVMLVRNIIDSYSDYISESELTPNGSAFAKYTTKPVTLNDGFDADGITVYVDVNKPLGTQIEIFYRILNKYDSSVEFENSNWYKMTKKSIDANSQLSSDYVEETYEDLNINYVGKNGQVYTTFDRLAVKVVFYSEDPTKVPTIKNLRIIATV
jgi:hypothetical protein